MDKLRRSWRLFETSLVVMRREQRLLLFPILTAVLTGFIILLFVCPVALQPTGHSYLSLDHWKAAANSLFILSPAPAQDASTLESTNQNSTTSSDMQGVRPVGLAWFALLYFVSMFCATFFNVAFYHQILQALSGQPVSISAGLRFALGKWQSILLWALFAGLVGYLIKTLEQRLNLIGQLVMKLIGAAWSVACVFVIPVLITDESPNPFRVLKKSALTLTRTWGEALIGYAGVSFGGAIVVLLSVAWLGAAVAFAIAWHLYWVTVLGVLAWLVAILLWSYLLNVASQIFRCALFLYASEGSLPEPYTQEMMAAAWKQKKNSAKAL
jgi:hypothetical protein